jgi:hypothetical protein
LNEADTSNRPCDDLLGSSAWKTVPIQAVDRMRLRATDGACGSHKQNSEAQQVSMLKDNCFPPLPSSDGGLLRCGDADQIGYCLNFWPLARMHATPGMPHSGQHLQSRLVDSSQPREVDNELFVPCHGFRCPPGELKFSSSGPLQ